MEITLTVEKRTEGGTKACRALRDAGKTPAVVYGAGGDTESLSVSTKEFTQVWQEAGESTLVTLTGLPKDRAVLIQKVELEPLYSTPLHVDFLGVRTDVAVTVEVPLEFVGLAPAEKELGAMIVKVMHSLNVEALPKDLPQNIEVDITSIATLEDQIHVKDIALPAGVTAVTEPDEVVALAQEAKEEEEEPVVEADVDDVEVEGKGKDEEGGDAAAPAEEAPKEE